MGLYLDTEIVKEAAFATRLSETPENWPQELTSELYKQLPFLSDYDVNVNLDRVEPNRGFAFGYADVSSKTERPEVEHQEAGIPHIRIPLVIQERAAKPFSIFLDGEKVIPLTEERVREALFNPATFDISTTAPRDPSLVEATMPPQRSGIGMGGEYKMAAADMRNMTEAERKFVEEALKEYVNQEYTAGRVVGAKKGEKSPFAKGKKSSLLSANDPNKDPKFRKRKLQGGTEKTSSILQAIASTINERDAEIFTEKVASDPTLVAGFKRSGIAPLLVDVFENTKRASAEERLTELADRIEPTAITFHKLPGGSFLVKSANVNSFIEKTAAGEVVPQQDAAQAMGGENAQAMQPGQTATAVSQPVPEEAVEPQEETKDKPIDGFGQYKVMDSMGNSLLGHVFPEVLDWDGNFSPKPIALFTNGSAYALQEGIMGELVGKGTTLPDDEPRGDGSFYCVRGGEAIATSPVTVHSAMSGPDGAVNLVCSDPFGRQFQVSEVEGLKEPQRISDAEYALPNDWKFMRLTNQVELQGGNGAEGAAPEVKQASISAELFFNGSYHLKGGCGLEKISTDMYQDMDPVHAEFMLGVLGVDGATAKMKVAMARKKGMVKLSNLKTITTLGERYATSTKTASSLMGYMPQLRRDFTKIAANLEDEGTVDKLLALNFINPENLSTFVGYLPELEETSEHLAEMLLYSYLGQKEISEGPVESAMKSVEEVIVGLKSLQQA